MSVPDPESLQPRVPQQAPDSQQSTSPTPPSTPTPIPSKNKNIVVCCDGTGNEFAGNPADLPHPKPNASSNSNVVKLYTALQLDANQFAYYHPGVGTLGDPSKKGIGRAWSVVSGLAFGNGFRENVLDAYRYLMQHYNSGDEVYLFGFSRGAYTVRALAGLLHGFGLLCRGNEGHIPYAWRMYTANVEQQLQRQAHTTHTDFSFRDTFSHKDFIINFVGLWDTVSSVGWVSSPLRLLHLAQNPCIIRGRHAISIDERRSFYQDNLWGPPTPLQIPTARVPKPGKPIPAMQDLVQVWFSGVHSDVGGSYPQLTSGLSNVTLRWMLHEAKAAGLRVDPDRENIVLGDLSGHCVGDPDGQLAPLYPKPTISPVHPSLDWHWWPLEVFPHRFFDRDDANEKMRIPLGSPRTLPAGAIVHPSVFHRLHNDPTYRPPNLDITELSRPALNPAPTEAVLCDFYQFQPTLHRKGAWRENSIIVLLVSTLEIALGLVLLALLARALGYVARHLIAAALAIAHRFFQLHPAKTHPVLVHFWPLLAALALIAAWSLLKALRHLLHR